jgi:hypothetical protein
MDWLLTVNPGFRSGRPVTDCLSHSVAPSVEAGGLYGSARDILGTIYCISLVFPSILEIKTLCFGVGSVPILTRLPPTHFGSNT